MDKYNNISSIYQTLQTFFIIWTLLRSSWHMYIKTPNWGLCRAKSTKLHFILTSLSTHTPAELATPLPFSMRNWIKFRNIQFRILRGRGLLLLHIDRGKDVKFCIFEQCPGGKLSIFDKGVGWEGGQNIMHCCLYTSTSLPDRIGFSGSNVPL